LNSVFPAQHPEAEDVSIVGYGSREVGDLKADRAEPHKNIRGSAWK
jgi:hypothetical protein